MPNSIDANDHSTDDHSLQQSALGESEVAVQVVAPEETSVDGHMVPKLKMSTESDAEKVGDSPIKETPDVDPQPVANASNPTLNVASTHSLPSGNPDNASIVASAQDMSARDASVDSNASATLVTSSSTIDHASGQASSIQAEERSRRRRTAIEVRSSNRLSGFFSQLMHRRDAPTSGSGLRSAVQEDHQAPSSGRPSENASRPSSPPPRPVTPPPVLPPPSLYELGLSLSVVTSDLSPSHFSTPPTSGAFLSPHYLLLCHAQGLDVLPLVSPPQPQPYALVRRVSFKSVVVMEQRGVLVAIAGRRDGVRVYALEEVKKAVEWRIEVEVRRERERARRETPKKLSKGPLVLELNDSRDSAEKGRRLSSSPTSATPHSATLPRKRSHPHISIPSVTTSLSAPLIPRTPTTRRPKPLRRPSSPPTQQPSDHPPPYSGPSAASASTEQGLLTPSIHRARAQSITEVLSSAPISRRNTEHRGSRDEDAKRELIDSSDDEEAINEVAAGSSGSQALDERTSAAHVATVSSPRPPTATSGRRSFSRRNRPANLDLSLSGSAPVPPEPSPVPTLMTLREALSQANGEAPQAEPDDDDEEDGQISLTQALMESRIPELPPPGSRREQQPILITASHPIATGDDEPSSPVLSDSSSVPHRSSNEVPASDRRRRRRWSVLLSAPRSDSQSSQPSQPRAGAVNTRNDSTPPDSAPATQERSSRLLMRSHSFRSQQLPPDDDQSSHSLHRPASAGNTPAPTSAAPPLPTTSISRTSNARQLPRTSRFIPRVLTEVFQGRRSDERSGSQQRFDSDVVRKTPSNISIAQAPPPKLEYVKLPGTKGALMVKAVETAKKSFLAILCGENGEKVELFAGTYRTALGLSRTFILPDSPRSLELQLQGDDLVEVFLVFSQNVFGLEPATVRVREVRIGRAERRAARRRAREIRAGEATTNEADGADEDTNVNVNVGVSVSVGSNVVASGVPPTDGLSTPPLIPSQHPGQHPTDQQADPVPDAQVDSAPASGEVVGQAPDPRTEELSTAALTQMGPYTTFQQLSFAPNFPLASIADEYVIPPTYPNFLQYRGQHEPDDRSRDLSQVQFSPPGLPVPAPAPPSKWFYRDPKGVIHGPWKASLMQAWYKDGLLPPDLPVRREEETEYVLLKDLRAQSVDPTHPFRSLPPPPASSVTSTPTSPEPAETSDPKPLLRPISLLAQPRHFGPPALFFSTRGGHSTAIVDHRGRSVLKGRFVWSTDLPDEDLKSQALTRMGDVKRLEAFDVQDRSVLVAMRQGGLEAVDLRDALLKPGDESRTVLPHFVPYLSTINRREPFVWRIGTPVVSSSSSSTILVGKSAKAGFTHMPSKKLNSAMSKSPSGRPEFATEGEVDGKDEVLFLGRKDDEMYICERNQGAFRILKLCPI